MTRLAKWFGLGGRVWLALIMAGALAQTGFAADTWQWRGNYSRKALTGKGYGYARNFETNWMNVATGEYGIPANGDFIVVKSSAGDFGDDFTINNVFGGLTYESHGCGSNQAIFTLQAGGPGIVVKPGVALARAIQVNEAFFNGYLVFVGSGDAIVDIRSYTFLYVQKSLYGNENITLVKRGVGTLANSEGYAQDEARNQTNGYYVHRKFLFGGVKLQQGTLAMRQYYWVRDCDFQFDGEGTCLYLGKFSGNKRAVSYYSLVLSGGRFRETANAVGAAHCVEGQDATCGLHFIGTQENTTFSGSFKGGAGLIWQPENSAMFSFRRSVSPTVGIIAVSNGTVRVTEGAGLPRVSAITVSGSGSTFRVDATGRADFPAAALEIADGGTLSLADGLRMTVASATAGGVAVADGLYRGAGAAAIAGSEQADWIDGAAYVRVGALDGDEVTVTPDATQTVGGANATLVQTTAQTWDVGSGTLTVAGEVTPANDAPLFIQGTGGTLNLNAGTTGWIQPLALSNLQVNIGGAHTFGAGESPVYIYHAGGGKSPTFVDGATVDRDLWFIDTSVAKSGGTSIVIPANATVTFNGYLQATNQSAISVNVGAGGKVVFDKLFHSRNGCIMQGSGTIVYKGPAHWRDRPSIRGTVTVELWATGNRLSGNMGLFSGGRLKAMVPYAVDKRNTRRQTADSTNNSSDGDQNTMMNASDSFTFDLCGNDQSIDQMGMYRGGGHVYSETPATFHLMTANSDWAAHNVNQSGTYASNDSSGYERQDKGWWEGAVNLSYEAAAATKCRFMMRQSPSTGRVDVVSGTLVFTRRAATSGETFDLKRGTGTASMAARMADEDGGWTNATAVAVHKGGRLVFEHGNAIGKDTDVYLYTGGTLEIGDGLVQKCHYLYVDDVKMPTGRLYGTTGQNVNGADGNSIFAGGGRLYARGEGQGFAFLIR